MSSSASPSASSSSNWFSRIGSARKNPGWWIVVGSAIAAALVSLGCFAPRYWLWPGVGTAPADLLSIEPELHRAFFALRQLQDPWQHIANNTNQVIEWRLLWPVVAHYTRLPENIYLGLPHLGCLAALFAVAGIVWRETKNTATAAGATLLAATSSWFFVSTGWLGYFDSWLMLALLLAGFARSHRVLFVSALLAPWIDERFILALPLCLAVRALTADGGMGKRPDGALRREAMWLIAGIAPYVVIRCGAELLHLRATSTSYWTARTLLPASPGVMFVGAWEGLRLGWAAVAVLLVAAFDARKSRTAVTAVLISVALNLCIADDLSRSASIALPALVAGVLLAWRSHPTLTRRALFLLSLGNLLLPAAHVIAQPFYPGEVYHRIPLHNLFTEVAQARHPPDFASSAAYNQRGLTAYQEGKLAPALRYFDAALRFDPTAARARANRGLIRFLGGMRVEGMADLDQALREQPDLHVARMQRANLRQQLGDTAGALADVREALRRAPADWTGRKEAMELELALTPSVPRE